MMPAMESVSHNVFTGIPNTYGQINEGMLSVAICRLSVDKLLNKVY